MCPKKKIYFITKTFELSKLMNFNPNRKKSNLVTCPILHRRPSAVIALDHVGGLVGAGYVGLVVDHLRGELGPPPRHSRGRLYEGFFFDKNIKSVK